MNEDKNILPDEQEILGTPSDVNSQIDDLAEHKEHEDAKKQSEESGVKQSHNEKSTPQTEKSKKKCIVVISCIVILIAIISAVVFYNKITEGVHRSAPTIEELKKQEYVDLGLPSGTLWAKHNYGAITEWDYGYYFSIHETDSIRSMLPSIEQIKELVQECEWEWIECKGFKATGSNGKSLCLPSAGWYFWPRHDHMPFAPCIDSQEYGDYLGYSYAGEIEDPNMHVSYSRYYSLHFKKDSIGYMPITGNAALALRSVIMPIPNEYVDLGLPSGTKWAKCNLGAKNPTSEGFHYPWKNTQSFSSQLPNRAQYLELIYECTWEEISGGHKIIGPNGNSIILPNTHACDNNDNNTYVEYAGSNNSYYWIDDGSRFNCIETRIEDAPYPSDGYTVRLVSK